MWDTGGITDSAGLVPGPQNQFTLHMWSEEAKTNMNRCPSHTTAVALRPAGQAFLMQGKRLTISTGVDLPVCPQSYAQAQPHPPPPSDLSLLLGLGSYVCQAAF